MVSDCGSSESTRARVGEGLLLREARHQEECADHQRQGGGLPCVRQEPPGDDDFGLQHGGGHSLGVDRMNQP